MSNRTSAELFGTFFEMLAQDPTEEHKKLALRLWERAHSYDFRPVQMRCDAALVKLGLARPHPNPYNAEDDGLLVYLPKGAAPWTD